MNWQALMAALEKWLWQAPYLDIPNYAWIASGLAILVVALYLFTIFLFPEDKKSQDLEAAEEGLEEPPEEAAAPVPEEPEKQEVPSPAELEQEPREAAPQPEAAKEEPKVEEPEEEEAPEEALLTPPEGWLSRLRNGLSKTQGKLTRGIEGLISGARIDDDLIEELEELLITSDLGVQASMDLLERLRETVKKEDLKQAAELKDWLKNEIQSILHAVESPLEMPADHKGPFVIMVTGVNGTGKTTTIGKLAMRYRQEGKSVLLGAADTFRAAAIQQLEVWGKRAGCRVISHQEGADPSAVAFDAIKAAKARNIDVVIIDTAGRLHTKVNLMEELKKVKRITARELLGAPHETLLVLDATTGQNAVQQAQTFNQALEITGLALTKLDGTAKGGIIVAISGQFKIPIRFIGVGEKIYDLQPFRAEDFVKALFE